MHRQVVLDTETTGIRVEEGHRIIEVGCIELVDRKLTGKSFHSYINPGRESDPGALAVHGISNEFLQDKPVFADIADALMDFILGAELIIHNAPFDLSFIDHELNLLEAGHKKIVEYCQVIDTLQMARRLHAGQRNNLDALCKRYGIDNTKRELHGALLDARLLAQVYLVMTGGQGSFFEPHHQPITTSTSNNQLPGARNTLTKAYSLVVLSAQAEEIKLHERYLNMMKQKGQCLWAMEDNLSENTDPS